MQTITEPERAQHYRKKACDYLALKSEALAGRIVDASWLVEYHAGEYITTKGAPVLSIPILVDGIIAFFDEDDTGTETFVNLSREYTMALDYDFDVVHPFSICYIKAVKPTCLMHISMETMQTLYYESEEVKQAFTRFYKDTLKYNMICARMRCLPMVEKVAAFIQFDGKLWNDLPEQYKARLLGVAPEHWTRYKRQHKEDHDPKPAEKFLQTLKTSQPSKTSEEPENS